MLDSFLCQLQSRLYSYLSYFWETDGLKALVGKQKDGKCLGWKGVELNFKGPFSFWDHNSPALGKIPWTWNIIWNSSILIPTRQHKKRKKLFFCLRVHKWYFSFIFVFQQLSGCLVFKTCSPQDMFLFMGLLSSFQLILSWEHVVLVRLLARKQVPATPFLP